MSQDSSAGAESESKKSSGWIRNIVFVIVLALVGFFGGQYYISTLPFETTDDAFIEGDVIAVSPQVIGQVMKVFVESNQAVEAGQLLLEINAEYYETKLLQQEAAVRLAKTQLNTAKTNVDLVRMTTVAHLQQVEAELVEAGAVLEEAGAQVEAADAEAVRTKQDFDRHKNEDKSIFSERETDFAESLYQVAKAELAKSRKQVSAAEASMGAVKARLADARSGPQRVQMQENEVSRYMAEIEVARAALEQTKLDIEHTKIYAPSDGRITRKNIDPGEQVNVGQMLMAVVPKEVWVEANFRETQLTDMRVGQPVEIEVDTYPGRIFMGKVQSIQSGTGARFSLLPPQNATGNYVKVVQRLPVKITFDEQPENDLLLVPGMSVVPKVRVR